MEFRDVFSPTETLENLEVEKILPDMEGLIPELDFIERYLDADGILHVRTCFDHSDLDPADLWEVFDAADGSVPLELLLPNID